MNERSRAFDSGVCTHDDYLVGFPGKPGTIDPTQVLASNLPSERSSAAAADT